MLKKIITQMIVLTMFIGFIPFGNFASASGNKEHTQTNKNGLKGKGKIEVLEARTETSKTYNNLDGTFSTEIYEAPVNFKENNGSWKEIDNDLQKQKVNGKGQFKNKGNNFVVTFDEKIEDDTKNVQVTEDQYNLDIGLKEIEQNGEVTSAKKVVGVATDNKIQYSDIFGNISTTYSVGENFVKEDIIIDKKPENGLPQTFSYQLSLENMTYEQINNQIYLKDASTGEMVYVIEAPFMYDASKPAGFESIDGMDSIPEEAKSYDIALQIRKENNTLWIDLIPDAAWLQDEERQYPIVIDPTIVRIQGNSKMVDTTIRKNFPMQTGGNDTELGSGTATDGNIVRSLMKFDVSPIPKNSVILSADLNLYLSSTNNQNPINLSLHSMKRSWDENTATWNSYATGGKWTAVGGDYDTTALSTVTGISSIPSNVEEGLKKWSLPTTLVKKWVVNSNTNLGVLLKSTTEGSLIYKKFISSENTTNPLAYKPKLVVTYKTPNRLGLESYWDYATHDISNGANYVNIGTNNNVVQYTDFSLFNYADFGLDFTRTYNSKDFEKSAFGYGWSFTGSEKLYIGTNGSDIDYKDADGTVHVFTLDGNTYVAPEGNYDHLKKEDATTYKLTTKTGTSTTFKIKESSTDSDVKVAYITEQKDLNSNTITYSYNTLNQLTSITTNLGTKLAFSYNEEGLIEKANYNEQEVTYTYTDGNLTRVVVKKDATTTTPTSFYYTTNGQLTKIIDSNGKKMLYGYNTDWDLVSVTEPSLDGQVASITKYSLDRTTNIITVTSPEGSVTRYGLNSNFSVTDIYDPSGETTTYTLDENYNILSEIVSYADGSEYTKVYEYDTKGNLLKTTDSKSATESYTYDDYSNLLTQTDANNQTTTNTYEKGNLKTTTSPKGEITSYQYDKRGDLKTITYPSGNTDTFDTDYSNNQKRTVQTDASLGIKTETITDFNGNMLSYKDGNGQLTTYKYNLKNELISVTEDANKGNGKTTYYNYDGNGNLKTVTNVAGKQMSLEYNAQNAVAKETNALGKATAYHYNADGELTEVVKANGAIIGYSNDEETQTSVVKINNVNQFTTKKDSLVTSVTNHTLNNQTDTYTESENGLLQRIDFSSPKNNAITYDYKNEESLETIKFGTNTITYTPDENGQTESLSLNGKTIARFKLNANGLLESTTLGNGASITNGYIGNETLLKKQTFKTANTTDTHTYDYDDNKQIAEVINNAGTVTYTYDAFNQLKQEHYSNGLTIDYTYDVVGNRTSKSITQNGVTTKTDYSYNDANQMTKADTQSIDVDVNGNVTNDGRYEYVWNAFDQLTEVKTVAGTTVATYKYDENGRRIYSNVDRKETYYRYDGTSNLVLFEEDAKGEIIKAYTYDDNGHPLTMTYGGATYYYLTNYRGDVLALTDESGTIVAEYTYDAWGNILSQKDLDQNDKVNLSEVNPYRYAGYRYDEETKLYYLMARYYNPDTGVFLSLDPVRGDTMNPITLNGYNYANNNPVMTVDPDGEFASNLRDRLKYGLRQALKKLLESWGVPSNLGEKIATNGFAFIAGSLAFKKFINKNAKAHSINIAQVRVFAKSSAKSLIAYSKKNLIRVLGKKAASMMIGGAVGVLGAEAVSFIYWTGIYAYSYRPKK